jgi:hypothetical protein
LQLRPVTRRLCSRCARPVAFTDSTVQSFIRKAIIGTRLDVIHAMTGGLVPLSMARTKSCPVVFEPPGARTPEFRAGGQVIS